MIVKKSTSVNVVSNLEDFLEKKFSDKCVSPALMYKDLQDAYKYHTVFSEMRKKAIDLKWLWRFPLVEGSGGDCIIVDSAGVASKRLIGFREIKKFSDYIVGAYGI